MWNTPKSIKMFEVIAVVAISFEKYYFYDYFKNYLKPVNTMKKMWFHLMDKWSLNQYFQYDKLTRGRWYVDRQESWMTS